jgi:hypothetical protein
MTGLDPARISRADRITSPSYPSVSTLISATTVAGTPASRANSSRATGPRSSVRPLQQAGGCAVPFERSRKTARPDDSFNTKDRPLAFCERIIDISFQQVEVFIVPFDTKQRVAASLSNSDSSVSYIGAHIDNPMIEIIADSSRRDCGSWSSPLMRSIFRAVI